MLEKSLRYFFLILRAHNRSFPATELAALLGKLAANKIQWELGDISDKAWAAFVRVTCH